MVGETISTSSILFIRVYHDRCVYSVPNTFYNVVAKKMYNLSNKVVLLIFIDDAFPFMDYIKIDISATPCVIIISEGGQESQFDLLQSLNLEYMQGKNDPELGGDVIPTIMHKGNTRRRL